MVKAIKPQDNPLQWKYSPKLDKKYRFAAGTILFDDGVRYVDEEIKTLNKASKDMIIAVHNAKDIFKATVIKPKRVRRYKRKGYFAA